MLPIGFGSRVGEELMKLRIAALIALVAVAFVILGCAQDIEGQNEAAKGDSEEIVPLA